MTLTLDIKGFFDAWEDWGEYTQDYWVDRTLAQGYAEASDEGGDVIRDNLEGSSPILNAVAGGGMGVIKLLGSIPMGIADWGMAVASSVKDGPAKTAYTLVSTPVTGMLNGAEYICDSVDAWFQGSLNQQGTFAMAKEITEVVGTAALMLFGSYKVVEGGSNFLNGLGAIEIAPQTAAACATACAPVAVAISGGSNIAEGIAMMASLDEKPSANKIVGGMIRTQSVMQGLTRRVLAQRLGVSEIRLARIIEGVSSGQRLFPKLEEIFGLERGYFGKLIADIPEKGWGLLLSPLESLVIAYRSLHELVATIGGDDAWSIIRRVNSVKRILSGQGYRFLVTCKDGAVYEITPSLKITEIK